MYVANKLKYRRTAFLEYIVRIPGIETRKGLLVHLRLRMAVSRELLQQQHCVWELISMISVISFLGEQQGLCWISTKRQVMQEENLVLSHIVVLYNGQQVGPCEKEVKQFIRSNGCLRIGAYQSLDKNIKSSSPVHNCCLFCSTVCKCNGDSYSAEVLPFEVETKLPEEAFNKRTREVSTCDRQDLHDALKEVVASMRMQVLSIDDTSSHGFPEQLI